MNQADSRRRDAKVRCRTERVVGQHAQPGGASRKFRLQGDLHGEVSGSNRFRPVALLDELPQAFGKTVKVLVALLASAITLPL
jgi:hypothetical protein